jgi:hypothetical protein
MSLKKNDEIFYLNENGDEVEAVFVEYVEVEGRPIVEATINDGNELNVLTSRVRRRDAPGIAEYNFIKQSENI